MNKNSGGPASPRNIGIRHSQGEFIAFLDSDDVWYPEKNWNNRYSM
ncbi:glycosyltransferase family A protein [Vibrio sinaloensis]|nr:glycosyltransferase family A protein [Vibrio sinaloensis]